jgi:hypothetical protein
LTARLRLLSISLVALWLVVAAPPAAVAGQPSAGDAIPLDRFLAEIDRLIAGVAAAKTPAEASPITLRVPHGWQVDVRGQTVEVSGRWLTVALAVAAKNPAAWPATRSAIRQRLAGIRTEAADARDSRRGTRRADARAALSSILEQEEFRQSAVSRWRERLQQRIGEWFEDLWSRLGGGPVASRHVAVALAWAATLAALGGLAFFLARTIASRPVAGPLGLDVHGAARPRGRELALRAVAEAKAGNSREAVRLAYNAALVRLEEQGAWRVDAARTPREYLPMLGASDARHPLMLDLTQRFERIWYGNRAATVDDTPRVTAHLEALGCLRPGERAT